MQLLARYFLLFDRKTLPSAKNVIMIQQIRGMDIKKLPESPEVFVVKR
jgi:hypothetical protein